MGIRRLTDLQLGSIVTSKLLNITDTPTTYQINSGNRALEMSNLSAFAVYYGKPGMVIAGSASFLNSLCQKVWDTITDDFTLAIVANTTGITAQVVIDEYAGN